MWYDKNFATWNCALSKNKMEKKTEQRPMKKPSEEQLRIWKAQFKTRQRMREILKKEGERTPKHELEKHYYETE